MAIIRAIETIWNGQQRTEGQDTLYTLLASYNTDTVQTTETHAKLIRAIPPTESLLLVLT
jgi:hypothetical protein